MKQQHLSEVRKSIIASVTDSYPSVLSKSDATEMIEFIISMLTDEQNIHLSKKLKWCNEYKELHQKGFTETRIRSIIHRRHSIRKNHSKWACEPCSEWIESQNK